MRKSVITTCLLFCAAFTTLPAKASISARLTSSLSSPQPLATPIIWTAAATDSNPNPVTFRFDFAAAPYTTFHLLQDFSTAPNFTWAETFTEGSYIVRVTARDYRTGERAQALSAPFQITSRLLGSDAVVNSTQHPLVALYSAPSCAAGSTMRVKFQRSGVQAVSYTDYRACHAGSMNFYVAGLTANTTYNMNYQVNTNGTVTDGPAVIPFTTGGIPANLNLPARTLVVPPQPSTDQAYKISLSSYTGTTVPFAADLSTAVVWYSPYTGQLMRTLGQTILMNLNGPGTGTGPFGVQIRQQILREFDLAGNIIRQTSADRVSEQLMVLGTDPIGRFNHDAVRLANGHTLALGDVQRAFPAGTQGSPNPVDIIGEMIIELDENFTVVRYWNAFDHDGGGSQLDINRKSLQKDSCTVQSDGTTPLGCPPGLLPGFKTASDWLHVNCVQLLTDGNILLSLRNQDWVIKISYQNGAVSNGPVLWKLGNEGDFAIRSSDSYPWFSAQHQPNFAGPTLLTVFDNGNSRVAKFGGNSRGMAFHVDEATMTVTTVVSADLGVYSSSQGSAQWLPNGNYQFQPGTVNSTYMQSLEVLPNVPNATVFNMQVQNGSYRTFRLPDMYTPPYGTAASSVTY